MSKREDTNFSLLVTSIMAEEDDQRFREIQREYLDFLDDDVSFLSHV